jgi:hypothetical protein
MTYEVMYTLYEKGLNPRLKIEFYKDQTVEENQPRVLYIEHDSLYENGDVHTYIECSASYPGSVKEYSSGLFNTIFLTSKGYSANFYFTPFFI